jgi:hypothetical protein
METHSNKIIQQKIDSVHSLPEGYSPNLNNKWEILAAGLAPKKKPLFLYFNKISAIAAILLLIGGISIFLIKSFKKNDVIKPIIVQLKPIEKPLANTIVTNPKLIKSCPRLASSKTLYSLERTPSEDNKQIEIVQIESIKKDSFVLLEKPTIILAEATLKKTKRFTEIDFNEPIIQEKITPTNMAFNQRFSFKIGASMQSNAGNANNTSTNNFGLTKQFN